MQRIDVAKLRDMSVNLNRFLQFEQEVEETVRQEQAYRRADYEEEKRAREKRARKKRLKKLRQMQQQ
jgi:hypothetical protein